MKDNIVTRMVDKFLGWKLPKNFSPDCGISFNPTDYSALEYPERWPIGTNLFDAEQAKEMIECLISVVVAPDQYNTEEGDAYTNGYFDGASDADRLHTQLSELQAELAQAKIDRETVTYNLLGQLQKSENAANEIANQLTAMQLYAQGLRDKHDWRTVNEPPEDGRTVQVFLPNYGSAIAHMTLVHGHQHWWCRGLQERCNPSHWRPDSNPEALNSIPPDLSEVEELVRDAERYRKINTPEIQDFLEAVHNEALHQRERWGSEHDGGKEDSDWYWLIGYLAGKAIRPNQSQEKALHHVITTAAVCLNWHAHKVGTSTDMRPGIDAAMLAAHKKEEK